MRDFFQPDRRSESGQAAARSYFDEVVLVLLSGVPELMPELIMPDDDASVLLDMPELIMPELVLESDGAGVTTGAGAGGGVSSFLPQAVRATANSDATSNDLFMFCSLLSDDGEVLFLLNQ
jgi:hypothetical protein